MGKSCLIVSSHLEGPAVPDWAETLFQGADSVGPEVRHTGRAGNRSARSIGLFFFFKQKAVIY